MGVVDTPGNIVHGACGKTWRGSSRAHCPACHVTFSCDSAAERHRTGRYGVDRRCVDPASVGLVAHEKPWGVLWSHAGPADGFDLHRLWEDEPDS